MIVHGLRPVPAGPQITLGSLLFTGVIDEVTDRMNIDIVQHSALNVGAGDMTIQFFFSADANNNAGAQPTGATYGFPDTNIMGDRDNQPPNTRDFGWGLAAGRLLFSCENSGGASQVVGTTDTRATGWRHGALQRRASDGWMSVLIDGVREAERTGPTGTISYQGGLTEPHSNFLCIGTEKWGFQVLGYRGLKSLLMIHSEIVYPNATNSIPSTLSGFLAQPGILACYPMHDGSGTTVTDIIAGRNATIAAGGVPAWSSSRPF